MPTFSYGSPPGRVNSTIPKKAKKPTGIMGRKLPKRGARTAKSKGWMG